MRRSFSSYKNYVCPKCFRQLNKCTCKTFPPYSLLFIDEGIQEHIRRLNEKGYLTIGCCEGHYKSYSTEPYIAFAMEYNVFETVPIGFEYKKNRRMLLAKRIAANDKAEYEEKKLQLLSSLLAWIDELDNAQRG